MKHNKLNKILVVAIVIITLVVSIVGCANKEENIINEPIVLSMGSFLEEVDDGYKNYNLIDNSYKPVESKEAVVIYDSKSGNYIYNKERKLYSRAFNKEFQIKDENIVSALMSRGGQYLSYFKNNDYFELKVIDLSNGEEIQLNSDVVISGTVMCWLDNSKMAYYGIDSKGVNGIFSYDLEKKEENLIFEIEVGYVELMRSYHDGVIFIEQNIDNNKIIKTINKNYENQNISEDFMSIKDIIITKDGGFILGRLKDDSFSIYKVEENTVKRLVYDFPLYINVDKGLSQDVNGNPLFLGKDSPDGETGIYIISDGYVKKIYTTNKEISFVQIN